MDIFIKGSILLLIYVVNKSLLLLILLFIFIKSKFIIINIKGNKLIIYNILFL